MMEKSSFKRLKAAATRPEVDLALPTQAFFDDGTASFTKAHDAASGAPEIRQSFPHMYIVLAYNAR